MSVETVYIVSTDMTTGPTGHTNGGREMFGALIQVVCGVALIALGNVVVGSVVLAGAGLTAAMSGGEDE